VDRSALRSSHESEASKDPTPPVPSYEETTYGPQWTHPHPSFSPDGKYVVYTSDVSGHSQVYVVAVEG
jgi:oligogalacturonide lyase